MDYGIIINGYFDSFFVEKKDDGRQIPKIAVSTGTGYLYKISMDDVPDMRSFKMGDSIIISCAAGAFNNRLYFNHGKVLTNG